MKALTIHQPFASLVALGVKTIETRTWPAPKALVGERIAIHAAATRAKSWSPDAIRPLPLPIKWGGDRPEPGEGIVVEEHAPLPVGFHEYKTWLPLGAVVATARLAACLPMVEHVPKHRYDGCPPTLPSVNVADDRAIHWWHHDAGFRDVTDQLPFGHYSPGNWAWMLDDIEPLDEPVPAKGRQRLWEWTP